MQLGTPKLLGYFWRSVIALACLMDFHGMFQSFCCRRPCHTVSSTASQNKQSPNAPISGCDDGNRGGTQNQNKLLAWHDNRKMDAEHGCPRFHLGESLHANLFAFAIWHILANQIAQAGLYSFD